MIKTNLNRASGTRGLLALAALSLAGCPGSPEPPSSRPSVLLVTIDSLRADRLGRAGGESFTPNLDALASRSVRFTQAQTPSPLTLPSLAALHTGRSPASTGVRLEEQDFLPPGETTLAEALSAAGYRTAAVAGSLLLHPKYGLDQGFGEYLAGFSEARRPRKMPVLGVLAARVVDEALEWLETAHREDFFLWVNFNDPHYFYSPPPPFNSVFASQPYDGEVAYVDRQLGRLLGALEKYGTDGRTMIVLAGNHGEGLMDHGEAYHGTLLYQSTLHVPLMIKPAIKQAGAAPVASGEVRTPVSLIDLAPTILQAARVEAPRSIEGRSLGSALEAGSLDLDTERPLYAEALQPTALFGWRPLSSVRQGRWKLIRSTRDQLFDLEADPGETKDLAPDHRDVAARLASLLTEGVPAARQACDRCGEMAAKLGLSWPPSVGPAGRDVDPEARIDLANDTLRAHRSLGRGMAESAELIYQDVLTRDPQNRIALIELGWIAAERQNLRRAKELWDKAQPLYADHGELYHLMGHVPTLDPERGTALFKLAAEIDPLNEEALYDAACGVSRVGGTEEALDLLARAIAAGFRDYPHMQKDTDLDPLRKEERFLKLVPAPEKPEPPPQPTAPAAPAKQ